MKNAYIANITDFVYIIITAEPLVNIFWFCSFSCRIYIIQELCWVRVATLFARSGFHPHEPLEDLSCCCAHEKWDEYLWCWSTRSLANVQHSSSNSSPKNTKGFLSRSSWGERENNPHQPFSREQCGRWGPQAESVVAPKDQQHGHSFTHRSTARKSTHIWAP